MHPSVTTPPPRPPLRRPARRLQALEARAVLEAGALLASAPMLRLAGTGDRTPVLVMPGFTASDASTVALRYHLRTWGYWAHGWRFGSNLGPTPQTLGAIRERLDAVHERHGRPVVLIGHSAGGLYARHLAREAPDQVRHVITLGSPIQMVSGDRSSIAALVDRLQHRFDPDFLRVADHARGPLPVPSTSIYTRTDGVVRWQVCLDVTDAQHENVEVLGTHSGLVLNPATLFVVGDRLRQPVDDWQPFHPPALLRRLYPAPASWETDRRSRR